MLPSGEFVPSSVLNDFTASFNGGADTFTGTHSEVFGVSNTLTISRGTGLFSGATGFATATSMIIAPSGNPAPDFFATVAGSGSEQITAPGLNEVPEPGTFALLGTGLAGLVAVALNRKKQRSWSLKSPLAFFFLAATVWCQPQVLVTGLQGPSKMILTPRGNLLVAETSMNPNAGRISLITRGGVRSSLLEGLPSGIEVTLCCGSGPAGLALRERTLYVALGQGDGERFGRTPGSSVHNTVAPSSPIFSSILEIRFSNDVDALSGPFRMTTPHHQILTDGGEVELEDGGGARARISILARFPVSEPSPGVNYRFANLWGLELSGDGRSLFVVDASMNSLARVDTATGRWRRLARFAPLPNPGSVGPPVLDAVPTSVRVYGDLVLVSYLTGFPFVPGFSRVVAVNQDAGTTEPFMLNLSSVTDVLWRPRPNARSQFFVLEFSQNQSAQPPAPGRLLRYDTPEPQVAAAGLVGPVSIVYDESTQDLYILELRGQILRLHLD